MASATAMPTTTTTRGARGKRGHAGRARTDGRTMLAVAEPIGELALTSASYCSGKLWRYAVSRHGMNPQPLRLETRTATRGRYMALETSDARYASGVCV